jgi:hypothetical protein
MATITDYNTAEGHDSYTWNFSAGYVNLRLLKLMVECDELCKVALFGTSSIDNFQIPDSMKPQRRVEAMFRFKDNVKMIIENSSFRIRAKEREQFENIRNKINEIEKYLNGTYYINTNHITHEEFFTINETFFNICMNTLKTCLEKLHHPLNNAGFIFRSSEEVDIDSLMKEIELGG